jgi:hypothetical protein
MTRGISPAGVVLLCLALLAACGRPPVGKIGRAGTGDGEFREPRGVSASAHGVAVVDKTGRLQLFGLDGRWRRTIPLVSGKVRRGLPIGVTWLADGNLAVAHTHESRVVLLSPDGREVGTFGSEGVQPGRFLMPQRITETPDGRFLVCDHGITIHRVQLLEPDGAPVRVIGGAEDADGGLRRPMAAATLPSGGTLVADQKAGLVLYDAEGRFTGPFTQTQVPEPTCVQGMCRDAAGDVFAVDLERAEIRRYRADGAFVGSFGRRGVGPEEFSEPWDVAVYEGTLYVADKENHRVVTIDVGGVSWVTP